MILNFAPFLTVWALLAMNIASPGPNVLNTITTAMGSGRGPGLASAAGVALGIGLWCLGMTLGMAALFQAVPATRMLLTVIAIGLLLWFASRYLRSAWAGWRHGTHSIAGRAGLALPGAADQRRRRRLLRRIRHQARARPFALKARRPDAAATHLLSCARLSAGRA